MKIFSRNRIWMDVITVILIIAAAVIVTLLVERPASDPVPHPVHRQEAPVTVVQPQSPRSIVAQLGGKNYVPHHIRKPNAWGMLSSGSFWIGSQKYGINTFTTRDGRDAWLKIAERFGVVPKWMTSTSVVYPSMRK